MLATRGHVHASAVAHHVRICAAATTILAPLPRSAGCATGAAVIRIEPDVGAALLVARVLVLTGARIVGAATFRAVLPDRARSIASAAVVDAPADVDTGTGTIGLPGGTARDGASACVRGTTHRKRAAARVFAACRRGVRSRSPAGAIGATVSGSVVSALAGRGTVTSTTRRRGATPVAADGVAATVTCG